MIRRHVDTFFSYYKLGGYFEKVCSISDVREGKPARDQFDCIMDGIRARKSEILMVGDTASDVGFARNCGIRVALLDAAWNRSLEPDYRLKSLKEVLAMA